MAISGSPVTQPAERVLAITRIFDAPRTLVFKAWTEPERLVQWWGPQGFTLASCSVDLHPGGAYRLCMRPSEGTDLWAQGAYREVVEPERLVFTWAWEDAEGKPRHQTLVTITFEEHGGKTKMTFHQALFESVDERDGHEGGWNESFDMLAEYLAEL